MALRTEFKLAKDAQTAVVVRTVHAAFLRVQLNRPLVRFTMDDNVGKKISSIERVLKNFPELRQFDRMFPTPGAPGQTQRQISNELGSPAPYVPVDLPVVLDITSGIPKRYPCSSAIIRMTDPVFGNEPPAAAVPFFRPGVVIADRWGLSKREIALSALAIVELDPAGDTPPALPSAVAAVLEACGHHSKLQQIVLPGQNLAATEKAAVIARDVNARLDTIVKCARLPHDFSEHDDHPPRQPIDPRKPALVNAFRPLGYRCHAEGMMVLVCSRRTASNLTVRLSLDFGTWGQLVHPTFVIQGLGFAIRIRLPVSPNAALRGVHWIVDEVRWLQIVENLAALVAELDRSVTALIEEALGPSPAWYEPESTGWAANALMRSHISPGPANVRWV